MRPHQEIFRFRQFSVRHGHATMRVGTDAVLLGAWAALSSGTYILDIGTGTGVIALMAAQRTAPPCRIEAIDINPLDGALAAENFHHSPWALRLAYHTAALQQWAGGPYDHIVSNPPYFIQSSLPPHVHRVNARHTTSLSYTDLLLHAGRLITPNGRFSLITPVAEGRILLAEASRFGWHPSRLCEVKTRPQKPPERLLLELQRQTQRLNETKLTLFDSVGQKKSTEYQILTEEFYL